ncbi:MAG: hypothetical protein EX271_10430 [Acidimicrobiales bacterium]|nr:MAG: hypothetical protein EX271_10430 [Acidimicrobiales bacterium]
MTKHVRDQNWFAVFLDFLIVVVGILIAFQITNWNEARSDARRGHAYVDRLIIEIEKDLTNLQGLLAYYDAVNASAERTVELLSQPAPKPEKLIIHAYRATEYSNFKARRATWDEIVSSGNMELLPPVITENSLSGYYDYGDTGLKLQGRMLDSDYRKRVRRIIPHKIQHSIRRCGDKVPHDQDAPALSIDCDMDATESELVDIAALLKNDPELLRDLRYQFSILGVIRGDLQSLIDGNLYGKNLSLEELIQALKESRSDSGREAR